MSLLFLSMHLDTQQTSRRIVSAALLVMLFFVLSRVTGLAREMIISAKFGTNAALDAYLTAFRIPDLLFQMVAGGALASAFIPTFSAFWNQSDHAGAWLLFSRVLNLITLLLVLLAGLAAIFSFPLVQKVIAPGYSLPQQELTAELMRWMLLGTIVFGAGGLIMGALNATQHFLLPAAAPVIYNIAIILAAWTLTPIVGIYSLVIGVVVGSLSHLLIQLPGLKQKQMHYHFSWTLRDEHVQEVARLMGPRVLGLLFVQLHFLVNTILASRLAEGSLSALNYAWLLMLLPQGIFAQAIGTAVFPTLSAQVATNQQDGMRQTLSQALRMVLFLTIPAAVGLYILRVPFIQILLERGEFTSESTQMVAYALQFYALGLVAHAAVEILVRAFYALHNTQTPVLIGIGAMVLNIVLSIWWVRGMSYGGLALANSVATGLEMLILFWLLYRIMGSLDGRRLMFAILRSTLAAFVMGIVLWFLRDWFPVYGDGPNSEILRWIWSLGGLVVAAVVYLAMSLLLQSEELRPVLAMVTRRIYRTRS